MSDLAGNFAGAILIEKFGIKWGLVIAYIVSTIGSVAIMIDSDA